jgi:hypothetical protein
MSHSHNGRPCEHDHGNPQPLDIENGNQSHDGHDHSHGHHHKKKAGFKYWVKNFGFLVRTFNYVSIIIVFFLEMFLLLPTLIEDSQFEYVFHSILICWLLVMVCASFYQASNLTSFSMNIVNHTIFLNHSDPSPFILLAKSS